jgi:AbrB family looped-hinge helix DNA binding protein
MGDAEKLLLSKSVGMTVTLKPKTEITVPKSIRRKAGIKPGDQFEFTVSGRVITIAPKLSPDDLQDEREIRDPKIRVAIQKGYEEFLAGKTRPIEEFFAERTSPGRKRARQKPGA